MSNLARRPPGSYPNLLARTPRSGPVQWEELAQILGPLDTLMRRLIDGVMGMDIDWPLLAPDGSASAPSYSFDNQSRSGVYLAAGNNLAVTGGNASGTDLAGSSLNIYGGAGTGAGDSGFIQFLVAPEAATSSSRVNTYVVAVSVTQSAITIGGWSLASHTSPGAVTIRGLNRTGTDLTGGALDIEAGRGTGTGNSGRLRIRTAPPAASTGSGLNAQQDAIDISHNVAGHGRIIIGGLDVTGSPGICSYLGADRATGVSNGSGGDLNLGAGESTGNASGGAINVQTSIAGGSGTAQNARANRWQWQSAGHYVPATTNTYDIGSASLRVRNIYAQAIVSQTIDDANMLAFFWSRA